MSRRKIVNIGIDLGTSRSVIACDNGVRTFVPSYVGYPKDAVSRKMFKNDIVFGEEAIRNKMAVDLFRPFDKGQLKYSDRIDKDKDSASLKNEDVLLKRVYHVFQEAENRMEVSLKLLH